MNKKVKLDLEENELTAKYISEIYKLLAFVLWTPLGAFCANFLSRQIKIDFWLWVQIPGMLICALCGVISAIAGRTVLIEWGLEDENT